MLVIKKINLYFAVLFSLVILLPKVSVISVPGFNNSVLIFDFVALILIFLLAYYRKLVFNDKFLLFYCYIIIVSLVSLLYLYNEQHLYRFFGLVRIFEYYIYYLAAREISPRVRHLLIKIFFYTLFTYCLYDFITHIGSFYRVSATFSGPWELGFIMLVLYIFLDQNKEKHLNLTYLFPIIIVILLTQSRITVISFFLYFAYKYRHEYLALIIAILFILFSFVFLSTDYINLPQLFSSLYYNSSAFLDIFNYNYDRSLYSSEVDPSVLARFHHWHNYLLAFYETKSLLLSLIFGNGLLSKGLILDGFYIRIIVDFGFFGVIYFMYLFIRAIKIHSFRPYLLALVVTLSAIEIVFASSAVVVFLLCVSKYKG
jgi:hypothetical protein